MQRAHIYFLIIAVLISALIHLFLINAAIEVSLKLGLFQNTAAEDLFQIKTVERAHARVPQRTDLSHDDVVSLERPEDRANRSEAEMADRREMLKLRGLVSEDASEAEVNEALKKLFEAERLQPDRRATPKSDAEKHIAEEVIAIDEKVAGEHINVPTRTITTRPDHGWATTDVSPSDEAASPGEQLRALAGAGGRGPAEGAGPGDLAPHEESLLDEGGTIPSIIKPPTTSGPLDIEAAELEDVAAEPAKLLRKYPALDDLLAVRLLTYHAPGEAEGYFMAVIEPRRDRSKFDIIPKDIIFIVDSSSSIEPPKLQRYVEGLQRCVSALSPHDRFDVVEFKTRPRRMADRLVAVTESRLRTAKFFLDDLRSSGNTDVYSAIQGLVGVRPEANRPYILFLVTDGRANRGVVENRNIINKVAEINQDRAAVYSFAGGTEFNEYLLDLLSYRNKGESRFEPSKRDIADSLFAFYEEVADPILLNLRYQIGTIEPAEVYPKVLPDFFLKSRVAVCGRYRNETEFSMQILGEVNGVTKEFIFKQAFAGPDTGDASVARQWAFQKIYYLVGQMVVHGEDQATIAEIRALGKKYGIETPYYE